MKKLIITSSIVLTAGLSSLGAFTLSNQSPVEPVAVPKATQSAVASKTVTEPIVTPTPVETPINEVVAPIEQPVYPTYNELMTQYNFDNQQHLHFVIDSLKVFYPERFTPENIEQSFARINEVFEPTFNMERDKQATIQAQLLARFTW